MYRTACHQSPWGWLVTRCSSCRGPVRPVGTYFPDSDRRSIHYPAHYTDTFQHEKKLDTTFICYRSKCFSAEKYSSPNRRRFTSPSLLLSSLFLFLTSTFCWELKSPYFPRILKLIWNPSSWRHLTTEDAGVKSNWTTCRAKILERGVIRNTWIRDKKATFLDDGQICLAAVNYMKIFDLRMLGGSIQVNGAFYSIEKSRVINDNILHSQWHS